jgi:SAM-dependent methyltransferase
MGEWFEDESFWELLCPFLFPAERMEAAADEITRILELIDFEGRDVLDLCCGPGRHAVELASRGYNVTGVDRTRYLLDKARRYAAERDVSVEWVRCDMREFKRPDTFDLVVNLYTSFGYFEDPSDDLTVLQAMAASLRPGGRLVIQMAGKEQIASIYQPSSADTIEGAGILVQQREVLQSWSRLRNRWTVVQDGRATSVEFEHTLYSAREITDLAEEAGFSAIDTFGDLDGGPYGPAAERLILSATL